MLHTICVSWVVRIADEFDQEFEALPEDVQTEILALSRLLQRFGPQLGRPRVDTLAGSRYEHERTAVSRSGRRMESGVRFRYEARGNSACGGK